MKAENSPRKGAWKTMVFVYPFLFLQSLGLGWEDFGLLHSLKLTAKAPENRPSQKETSIPTIHFQGLC